MKRTLYLIIALLLAGSLLAGCTDVRDAGSASETSSGSVRRYFLNEDADQLIEESYVPANEAKTPGIEELIVASAQESADEGRVPLLSGGIQILTQRVEDGVLTLNMSSDYAELDAAHELLTRAGLVKTFTQVEGVSAVSFLVNGAPLLDSQGEEIGKLTPENFVENAGRSIHSYTSAKMRLYFTDESGSILLPEDRSVYYSSNEPLEKAVVDELIRGTSKEGCFPTLSPDTKILSVAIQEGICYVNFDESFRSSLLSVREDIQIYSIVNSLADTCHVNKVQFTINGKSNLTFRENMKLDMLYEKNDLLVQSNEH